MKGRVRGGNILGVLVFVIGIFALVGLAQPAEACMGGQCCDCTSCGPGCQNCNCHPCSNLQEARLFGMGHQTRIEFLSRDHARLSIMGFVTTHFETGIECITTLSPVPGIRSIDSLTNYNTLTGEPFLEVSFFEDANATQGVAQIARNEGLEIADGSWQGFVSTIVGNVDDGVLNHFVLDITLEEGVRPEDLIDSLRKYGSYITSSSEGGFPVDGHAFVRLLGDNPIIVMSDDLGEAHRSLQALP